MESEPIQARTAVHEEIAKIHKFERVIESLRGPFNHVDPADLETMRSTAFRGRETARREAAIVMLIEEQL